MNDFQIIYVASLAACLLARCFSAAWVFLVLNCIATLTVCLAFDLGEINDRDAVTWYIVIDTLTGAFLAFGNSKCKLIAVGYVFTIPIYAASIVLDVQNLTTFAIVYPIAAAQLGVLFFGNGNSGRGYFSKAFGNNDGRSGGGLLSGALHILASARNSKMDSRIVTSE